MREDFIPAKVEYVGGTNKLNTFTVGNAYSAYFVEYWDGKRDNLHVRNNAGQIVDFVPMGDFRIISDPNGVLELDKEAHVRYIVKDEPDPESLKYGKSYRALGCDKDGFYLVEDETGYCYFFEASNFEVVYDPYGLLSTESLYYSLYGDKFDKPKDPNGTKPSAEDLRTVRVKLITGAYMYMEKSKIVGVCQYHGHPGALTKGLVRSHECDKKKCRYLKMFAERPFWEARETGRKAIQEKRELHKKHKKEEQEKQESLLAMAQNCADQMMMPIKITSVQKLTGENNYTIFYISEEAINDAYMYGTLGQMFTWLVGTASKIRHVKDMNGRYAVISEKISRSAQFDNF